MDIPPSYERGIKVKKKQNRRRLNDTLSHGENAMQALLGEFSHGLIFHAALQIANPL